MGGPETYIALYKPGYLAYTFRNVYVCTFRSLTINEKRGCEFERKEEQKRGF